MEEYKTPQWVNDLICTYGKLAKLAEIIEKTVAECNRTLANIGGNYKIKIEVIEPKDK